MSPSDSDKSSSPSFFFDNCVSPKLVEALKKMDATACHLRDHYDQATPDEVWISKLKGSEYVLVSCDLRILSRVLEARALKDAGLIAFFLFKKFPKMDKWTQLASIAKIWPTMLDKASSARPGEIYQISENGKIERHP